MKVRASALLVGVVFGVVLCWSGMSSPTIIRQALLLQHSYLFLFFASAVAVATISLWLLRRRVRALITGQPIDWRAQPVAANHILGSAVFGIGWGLADACPGPIATQVGQGIPWAVATLAGVFIGVYLFLRRAEADTEPASEATSLRGLGETNLTIPH